MDYIVATYRDSAKQDLSEPDNNLKVIRITEENKNLFGSVVMDDYYVLTTKLELAIIPEADYFDFKIKLWSQSNMLKADVGDWLVFKPSKYELRVEVITDKELREYWDIPEEPEPEIVDPTTSTPPALEA